MLFSKEELKFHSLGFLPTQAFIISSPTKNQRSQSFGFFLTMTNLAY